MNSDLVRCCPRGSCPKHPVLRWVATEHSPNQAEVTLCERGLQVLREAVLLQRLDEVWRACRQLRADHTQPGPCKSRRTLAACLGQFRHSGREALTHISFHEPHHKAKVCEMCAFAGLQVQIGEEWVDATCLRGIFITWYTGTTLDSTAG